MNADTPRRPYTSRRFTMLEAGEWSDVDLTPTLPAHLPARPEGPCQCSPGVHECRACRFYRTHPLQRLIP